MVFKKYLFDGESVIYESKAPYVVIKKGSSSKNHSLAITNKGRIIAHDTGGVFGEEKVFYFHSLRRNNKIKVDLLEDKLQLVGENHAFKFNLDLELSEFFCIKHFMGKYAFRFSNAQNSHCYIIDNDRKVYLAEYSINYQGVNFKFKEKVYKYRNLFFKFGEIESFQEQENNILKIKGRLNLLGSDLVDFLVYVPHSPDKEKIISLINNTSSIYHIANEKERITSANLKCQLSKSESTDYDVYVLDDNSTIRFILQNSLELLFSVKKEEIEEYYNEQLNQNVLGIKGDHYFVAPKYTQNKEVIQFKNQNFSEFIYIDNVGILDGVLNGVSLSQKQVDVAISLQEVTFIDGKTKLSLLSFKNKLYKYLKEGNLLFILGKDEVMKLEVENGDENIFTEFLFIEQYKDEEILLNWDKFPYYFKQAINGLILYNGREKHNQQLLKNEDIQNVKMNLSTYSKSFRLASFNGRSKVSEKSQYYIPINLLDVIIHSSFIASKTPMLAETSPALLYKSMVRQISDLILYEYFGQLVALYEGIDRFYEQNMPEEERIAKLVSYLYYGIQSQRKRMDSVSVHFPAMLYKIEQNQFQNLGKEFNDKYFKQFQQQLLGISNQMKSSLLETENNLAHLRVLIPNRSAKELIDEKRKSGNRVAGLGVLTALGVTILTGGKSFPMLLAPVFMKLNTNSTVNTMRLQEEIKTGNEQNRIEFYLLKALDSFDHFIHVMMPYYILKVNEIIFKCYKKASVEYQPLLNEIETKQAMLHRIGEIYTFKKLPVDQSIEEVSRQDLLNYIFEIAEAANQSIETYENSIKITNKLPTMVKE